MTGTHGAGCKCGQCWSGNNPFAPPITHPDSVVKALTAQLKAKDEEVEVLKHHKAQLNIFVKKQDGQLEDFATELEAAKEEIERERGHNSALEVRIETQREMRLELEAKLASQAEEIERLKEELISMDLLEDGLVACNHDLQAKLQSCNEQLSRYEGGVEVEGITFFEHFGSEGIRFINSQSIASGERVRVIVLKEDK